MKKQSGSALVVIIVIILVLLLVGAAVAVGGAFFLKNKIMNSNLFEDNPLVSKAVSTALNEKCEYDDKDLCKYISNMISMKDYSYKFTNKADGSTVESLFEVNGDDKNHMVVSSDGKENYNTIRIGNTTYTKDYTDNKWVKQTDEPDKYEEENSEEPMFDFDDFKMDELITSDDKTEYKKIGKEPCGKLTCFKYEVVSTDATFKEYIWFDDRQYLTRKTRTEQSGSVSEGEFFYDKVSIKAPSPVKELKPGEMLIPGGGVVNLNDAHQYQQELQQYRDEMENSSLDLDEISDDDYGDYSEYSE